MSTAVLKQSIRTHGAALVLVCAAVLAAYPAWLLQGVPALDDLTRLNVPQRLFLAFAIQHAELPLWNPFSFAGQPFLAAGQSGPLYLPNLIYAVVPIVAAFKVSYLAHQWLAAIGMYAAAYGLWQRRRAAVVSALSFATCGFLIGHQIHTQMFDAMCWLPVLFALANRLLNEGRWGTGIAFTFAFAGEVYAGHPQITFYVCLYLTLYVTIRILQTGSRAVLYGGLRWVAAMAGGFLLSAAQWFPTLMLVSYSDRQNATPAFLLQNSLPLRGLLQWLMPFTAGGGYSGQPFSTVAFTDTYGSQLYWEFTCYCGLIALLLAATAALSSWRRSAEARTLSYLFTVTTLLALGGHTWLGTCLTHVPGFNLFRVPARYIGLSDFSLALLAGLGLRRLHDADAARIRRLLTLICVTVAIAIALLTNFRVIPYISERAILIPLGTMVAIAIASIVPARRHTWHTWLISLLAVVDCVSQASLQSTFIDASTSSYLQQSDAIAYIRAHESGTYPFARIVATPDTSLGFDQSLAWDIPSVNGYDSLEPVWYAQHVDATWNLLTLVNQPRHLLDDLGIVYWVTPTGAVPGPLVGANSSSWSGTFRRLPSGYLSLQITTAPLSRDGTAPVSPLLSVTISSGSRSFHTLVTGLPTQYMIQLPAAWPRGVPVHVQIDNQNWDTVYNLVSVAWLGDNLRTLVKVPIHERFGPKAWAPVHIGSEETVWKNPDPVGAAWFGASAATPYAQRTPGEVSLINWGINGSRWVTNSSGSGYLIVSQLYDPGWHATVDGQPVPVVRADEVLTAVRMPGRGRHVIVLRYRPVGFAPGLAVSLSSGVFAIALAVWRIRRARKTAAANSQPQQS